MLETGNPKEAADLNADELEILMDGCLLNQLILKIRRSIKYIM